MYVYVCVNVVLVYRALVFNVLDFMLESHQKHKGVSAAPLLIRPQCNFRSHKNYFRCQALLQVFSAGLLKMAWILYHSCT